MASRGSSGPSSSKHGGTPCFSGCKSAPTPALSEPYVEIAAGSASERQYFPPGDEGERWLNVTFLRGAMVGTRISLRGDGVMFTAPAASLRLFDGGFDLSRSLLVLAPIRTMRR